MQFTWWSGDRKDIVWEWGIEVKHTRGSGPQYASIFPHTGIGGRQGVPSRLVTSILMVSCRPYFITIGKFMVGAHSYVFLFLEFLDLPETSCELQPIPSLYFLNFHQ
jgi:hypothetical protein